MTNLVGQGLTILLNLSGSVLAVRLMGAEVGIYFLFVATTTLLSFFLDPLGMKWSATYLVGRDPGRARRVLAIALVSCVIAALCIALLGPPLVEAAAHVLPGRRWVSAAAAVRPFIGLVAVAMSVNLLHLVVNAILLGFGRYIAYNTQQALAAGFFAGGAGVMLLLGHTVSPGLVMVFWTIGIGLAATFGLGSMVDILRMSGASQIPLIELRTGLRAYALNCLSFLHQRIDFYMVSWFLGAPALALYGTATSTCEALGRSSAIVGSIVYSRSVTETDARMRALMPRLIALVASVSFCLGLIFLILGKRLIPVVFGEGFAGAYAPAAVLVPGIVCLGATSVLNNFFSGKGYPLFMFWVALGALALNVVLNLTLIPNWGIVGAATSSSCSYALWFVLLVAIFRSRPRAGARPEV